MQLYKEMGKLMYTTYIFNAFIFLSPCRPCGWYFHAIVGNVCLIDPTSYADIYVSGGATEDVWVLEVLKF